MDKTKQPPRAAKRCCRATLLAAAAFACCCGSYAAAQEDASAAPSTTQSHDEASLSAPLQVVQDAISAGTADVSANASADADVAMPLAEVAPPCSAPGACGAELRLAGGMGGMARPQARAESEAAATTGAAAAEAAAAQTTGMVPSGLRGSASVGQQARPRAARRPPGAATR